MLKKSPLAERAYLQLVRAILRGEYPAGCRLTEAELSNRFGISRTPAREALRRLAAEELVEFQPRRGCRVTLPEPAAIQELFEFRAQLECLALALALPRTDPAVWRQLATELMADDSPAVSLAVDETLHEQLAACCGNRHLGTAVRQSIRRCAPFRHYRNAATDPRTLRTERLALLEALAAGRIDEAKRRLAAHLRQGMPETPGSASCGGSGQPAHPPSAAYLSGQNE